MIAPPGDNDVVIAKGKKWYFHPGNQRLRDLVQERVDEYKAATAKADKSSIIAGVIQTITTVNGGQFVKLDPLDPAGQQWIPADDLLCREKVSATFRETIKNSVKRDRVSSSSDLINALRATKISGNGSSSNNLRLAVSTGNFLKTSRSGQFSAAKKLSFNRLQNAGFPHPGSPKGNMGNAQWSSKSSAAANAGRNLLAGKNNRFSDIIGVPLRGSSGGPNNPLMAGPLLNANGMLQQQQHPKNHLPGGTAVSGTTNQQQIAQQLLEKNQLLYQQIQQNQMKLQQMQQQQHQHQPTNHLQQGSIQPTTVPEHSAEAYHQLHHLHHHDSSSSSSKLGELDDDVLQLLEPTPLLEEENNSTTGHDSLEPLPFDDDVGINANNPLLQMPIMELEAEEGGFDLSGMEHLSMGTLPGMEPNLMM